MTATHSDLLEQLDLRQCECLNASKEHTLRHAIELATRDDPAYFLQSDCDEELLIHISMMQACKISAIKIEGPANSAPSSISIFVNKLGIDFDSAKSEAATQTIQLNPGLVTSSAPPVDLKYVLFQNVRTLSIFVPCNLGDSEETVRTEFLAHKSTLCCSLMVLLARPPQSGHSKVDADWRTDCTCWIETQRGAAKRC